MTVDVEDDHITFKGCNYNYAPLEQNDEEGFKVASNWVSSLIYCYQDNDQKIRDLFNAARTSNFLMPPTNC